MRPRLEALEGRRVLSTLTVSNYLDGPYPYTLRDEIAAAQPGDTIVFDPSLNGQTITLPYGELEISKNLTIQGPGAGLLAISGGGDRGCRVFQVDAGATVTISGLTIEDGFSEKYNNQWTGANGGGSIDPYDGYGGGILNLGTLTLGGCTLAGNTASPLPLGGTFGMSAEGGGVFNHGTMTIDNGCTLTGNAAQDSYFFNGTSYQLWHKGEGGGIYNNGTMTLSGSTVTGNTASAGGGIFNDTQGILTILSSTVINNTAADGADICSLGKLSVKNSTIGKISHK